MITNRLGFVSAELSSKSHLDVFCSSVKRSNNIIEDSLFEIIRGRTRDLSLVYAQVEERKFYSFLSFGWGFTADVDIESEKYRFETLCS